jgi:c-di-GMP-binding flagellar brake protein YcgR
VDAPKRRWKRFKVDIRVKLRRWEEPEESALVVRTYELSEGGMSVYASETLETGTFMLAELSLPNTAKPMRLRAVVRNRRGFRCGLQFVDLPEAERTEILRYLGALIGVIEI